MRLKLVRTIQPLRCINDTVLITGDGRTCPDDIERFRSWKIPYDVMSIGRSIKLHNTCHHWVNVDGADSKWWAEHLPGKPFRHTIGECAGYDCIWDDGQPDGTFWHGSTALFATLIASYMEYRRIVLAGCPLDENGHWYFGEEHRGPVWEGGTYRAWLDFSQEDEASKVRSLSGYTAMIVGNASKEWLHE